MRLFYSILTFSLWMFSFEEIAAHPEGHLPITSRLYHQSDTLLEEVGGITSSDRWVSFLERQEFGVDQALGQLPAVYLPTQYLDRSFLFEVNVRGGAGEAVGLHLDGLRIPGYSGAVTDFLRFGSVVGYEEVELLRGSQGSVHGSGFGSAAIGVYPNKADSVATGKWTLEYGTDSQYRTSLMQSAEGESLNYFLSGEWRSADHEESSSLGVFLGYRINDYVEARLSLRNWHGRLLGDSIQERWDASLASLTIDAELAHWWQSQWIAGVFVDGLKSREDRSFESVQLRWNNQFSLSDKYKLYTNLHYESNKFERGALDVSDDLFLFSLGQSWDVIDSLTVSANLGWEYSEEFGVDQHFRFGSVWRLNDQGSLLRASYGDSRDFVYEFGGSMDRSCAWDLGFEQTWRGTDRVSLTYFEADHAFADKARGVEFRLRGQIGDQGAGYRASYTGYFDVDERLPRHVLSGSIDLRFWDKLVVGAKVDFVGNSDLADDFFTAHLFAEYLLHDGVRLHARIENIFDEEYALADQNGISRQGEGLEVFAGLSYEW